MSIIPILGPNVCKYRLVWAMWIPRVRDYPLGAFENYWDVPCEHLKFGERKRDVCVCVGY